LKMPRHFQRHFYNFEISFLIFKIVKKSISELRQDLVSGDWVVIATGRAKRPHEFSKIKRHPFIQPKKFCPFETLHKDAVSVYSIDGELGKENWRVEVIPNKYPAFGRGVCAVFQNVGPYQRTDGVGFHEVVIMRDHTRSIGRMSAKEVEVILRAYQDRFFALKDDACVEYISVFHNHGVLAGASISHPHSQIIAIPVVPPDIQRSLEGSARYFHQYKTCVHCEIVRYELKEKRRVIYENEVFAALAPYASKAAFEIRIFPKFHAPHFEDMSSRDREACADVLRSALAKLYQGLKNPDYNFFIHTAPVGDSKEFRHYHWHIEIIPKTGIWAGFEIGTGIEISVIAPETSAAFLRKIKV
jgi:UDPglucose--hexose-1-phosphate uridylyltransferase